MKGIQPENSLNQRFYWNFMDLKEHIIKGIKVINIIEENAVAIEKMVNKAIDDIHKEKIKILDIQITGDNLIIIMGKIIPR